MRNTIGLLLLLLAGTLPARNTSMQDTTKIKKAIIIEKAHWLLGAWQQQTAKRTIYEVWRRQDDSTYSGKSYFLTGNDTVILERVSLAQRSNNLFYIPTVQNQNNAQPVVFKLTAATPQQLVFENPLHDFPQKIVYTQITADSLLAEISGMAGGQQKARQFPMKRLRVYK
jgi:hypothetical protein